MPVIECDVTGISKKITAKIIFFTFNFRRGAVRDFRFSWLISALMRTLLDAQTAKAGFVVRTIKVKVFLLLSFHGAQLSASSLAPSKELGYSP